MLNAINTYSNANYSHFAHFKGNIDIVNYTAESLIFYSSGMAMGAGCSTALIQTEISRQLFNGLAQNLHKHS